ncbi:MAG: helicase-associated domain-containing protein [Isosphaeraceae bacterium]
MAVASQSPPPSSPPPDEPRQAYRWALGRYKAARLAAIRLAQGLAPDGDRIRPAGTAEEITEHLDHPAAVEALAARVPIGSRLALSLFAVTETTSMPMAGLAHALAALGAEPIEALVRLLDLGLLAIEPNAELGPIDDFTSALKRGGSVPMRVRVHPTVPHAVRIVRPEGGLPTAPGSVVQVRESDGLEPILRLGAIWQRAGAEPLRQTQQGTLYKRDRERVEDDPVLAGAVTDAIVPLPHPAAFWMALARRVGLVEPDSSGQRLLAAPTGFWADNAVHLPQMIATGWLTLRTWHEPDGAPGAPAGTESDRAVPYLRPAVLLWLATLGDAEWVALDDLAGHLSSRYPEWDRPNLTEPSAPVASAARDPAAQAPSPRRGTSPRGRARPASEALPRGQAVLESILLAAAYPLGLVRAAEEPGTGRRVVQLTPLGRYVLASGPTPPPRPTFDQFLFVQPNFEMIAYRQGLTPHLVGKLSRFAHWSQIGAALELRLTRESIIFGLEGGLTPESMLETLGRHTQRPLPPGIVDAVRTWATRRERVTYYAAATLMEFSSTAERDQALESWPPKEGELPTPVGERFLLVDDERTIPFDRFRLTGARDYRRPPEACVTVEPDGVSMALDPSRSDLLVDAEIGRFADEVPASQAGMGKSADHGTRRFTVSAASLRRGMSRGVNPPQLADWYSRRTGGEMPPAVRLILASKTSRVPPLKTARMTVLNLPSAELLDGLLQHPATSLCLGERLGPKAVSIPDDQLEALQNALKELGIHLDMEPIRP